MNIWDYQQRIARDLSFWAVSNMLIGGLMQFIKDRFWKGFGIQMVGWGFIDLLLAIFGSMGSHRRKASMDRPEAPLILRQERENLRRILWINAGLDVLYILIGIFLADRKGRDDHHWRGQGRSISVQGIFLLIFDLFHARTLRSKDA